MDYSPNHIDTGVVQGESVSETIVLENKGFADLQGVTLELIQQDGSAAPGWALINYPANISTIPVGDQREVNLSFSPPEGVQEGQYYFYLRVSSSNYQTTDIEVYTYVALAGIGDIHFKVADIYTGTLDEDNNTIQGLSGARVTLQNEKTLVTEPVEITDSFGEVSFVGISAGRYKFRVTAENHQEYIGRVWVKPGVTANEEVLLSYNIVTVEWEVIETTIEDVYEIVLSLTYETNVPAPIMEVEPTSVTLPDMKKGDVFTGEVRFTNNGFIRVEDLLYNSPQSDQYLQFEILGEIPETLEAMQSITVPYRITCLTDLKPEDNGSGGVCRSYIYVQCLDYSFKSMNGMGFSGTACSYFTKGYGQDCGGEEIFIPGGPGGPSGPGGPGGPSGPSEIVRGVVCAPPKDCDPDDKSCKKKTAQNTMSQVDLVRGEYTDDEVDLSVKIPGGTLEIERDYYDDDWNFNGLNEMLELVYGFDVSAPEYIKKNGISYRRSNLQQSVYSLGPNLHIYIMADGYRWEDKTGNWKLYDPQGRLISQGILNREIASYIYAPGDNGKMTGIMTGSGNQVFWIFYNAEGKISSVQDASGRVVEYFYDAGKLTKVVDVLGNESFYSYDSLGRIESKTDPAARIASIGYNNSGYVASVTDDNGTGTFFEYGYDAGRKEYYSEVTFSSGRVHESWYDRNFDLFQTKINGRTIEKIVRDGRDKLLIDANGNSTYEEYDEWNNLKKRIYPDSSSVLYEHEPASSKMLKSIDERGIITEYIYDEEGNRLSMIEAKGTETERITEFTYDIHGNPLTEKILGDTNTAESLTIMEYDDDGNMNLLTDPEGNTTEFTHDIMGNVLTRTDALGKVWQNEYNNVGHLVKTIDPLNNIKEIFYDEAGNKVREIDAEGRETDYEYDGHYNLVKTVDASDNFSIREYNSGDKLVRTVDPEGKENSSEYDLDGRLIKQIDGNNNETIYVFENNDGASCSSCSESGSPDLPSKIIYPTFIREFKYDKRGRKIEERDILSDNETYITQFEYDLSGNLISKTDPESKVTAYEYDSLNRLIKVTDPVGNATEYIFDIRDNMISIKDANENIKHFEYDRNDRNLKEIRPMGEETVYEYNAHGLLSRKVDGEDRATEYEYDNATRLKLTKYFEADDHSNPVKTVSFTYDKVGNLKTYDDGITSAVYDYDVLNRKLSETVSYGLFDLNYSYSYYKNGLKKTFTGTDGVAYEYAYDNNNQIVSLQTSDMGSITVNSYIWDRPDFITLPGGSTKEYTYDPLMRNASIMAKDPIRNSFMSYQYTYDKADNILVKSTEHGVYSYEYDDLYRLTNVDNPDFDDESYTYDATGNRLTASGIDGIWDYNDNSELLGYDNSSFVYDNNGNMMQKTSAGQVVNYIYNVENRIARVENETGSVIAEYYYDPMGRRLWKDTAGIRTYFHYSDEGLIGEYDADGIEIMSYGYKPDSEWTTDPLFIKKNGEYYFYVNDHLGTPMQMVDSSGNIAWSAYYSSFGNVETDPSSTVENNLRFAGQYYDKETGMHYNRYRYYDSYIGRYLTPKPIGCDGDNSFVYVGNNPLRFID